MQDFTAISLTIIVCCSAIPAAWAWEPQDAQKIALEYEQELKARQQKKDRPDTPPTQVLASSSEISLDFSTQAPLPTESQRQTPWNFTTELRMGVANYKEKEQNLESDYTAFYPELDLTLVRQLPLELELSVRTSLAQSLPSTESWDVRGALYQTNDMDFFRLDSGLRLGKILYAGLSERLRVVPYVGYGYRFFHFLRDDFNILNRITSRDTVTESYQIHYVDTGFTSSYTFTDHWKMGATASVGGVFYNQANNSAMGRVRGEGGTVGEGSAELRYELGQSFEFSLGAFVDLQALQGGDSNGGIMWPDNHLYLYGGNAKVRVKF